MITGRRRRQRGSELVEFAISAVLLFILLFGIIEFSVALFDKATITNAAREGARTGILFRPSPRSTLAEDDAIRQAVERYADAYLISLGGEAQMSIDIERVHLSGNSELTVGDEVIVTVTYPYRFLIVPDLIGNMGGTLNLSSTSVMRAE